MNKKIIYALLIVFITISTIIVLYSINVKKDASELEKVSLRLKWVDQAQFAGYYVANSQKLYVNRGLEVEINPGGPDISPIQMVATGANDFGITGADQIILAREKGIPLVALAVLYKDSPVVILSLEKNGIKTPKDLEGKKVEIAYGRDEEVIYNLLLEKEGVDRKKIKEISELADWSRVISEQVDARVDYELNGGIMLPMQGFPINMIKPRDYGINFYADTLFTTEKMILENPKVVRDFVQASIEGWEMAIKDQEKAIDDLMLINSTLNREHQSKFLKYSVSIITNNGDIGYSDKKVLEEMQTILLSQGLLKNSIEMDKAFTNEFLK